MQDETRKEKSPGQLIRTAVECLFLVGCLVVAFMFSADVAEQPDPASQVVVEEIPTVYVSAYDKGILNAGEAEGYPLIQYGEAHFSALCYPGLTAKDDDAERVSIAQFKLHMEQLSRAGYQTITPEEASAFLLDSVWPPSKAVMVIIEDSTLESANLAKDILKSLDYTAVLAVYASDLASGRISGDALRELETDGHFVVSSLGYERSYINVFDMYGNYIGELSAPEFDTIASSVSDYSYSLMDYKRDSDRLPTETDEMLAQRIAEDYRKSNEVFGRVLGRIPNMLMLTGPNTGAFGESEAASAANGQQIKSIYAINFNRAGTAINTQAIPVYDLSYMRVKKSFSANHLMMKLWDDTADDVMFAQGNPTEAAKWMVDRGIAEFDAGQMILTTLPKSDAIAAIKDLLVDDFELDVTLQGVIAGRQSIFLRTDRECEAGVELCVEDGVLTIRDPSSKTRVWQATTLPASADTPTLSQEEADLNAQIALYEGISKFDEDPSRRNEAARQLQELKRLKVRSSAEGGKAASVVLSGTERQDRQVHVRYTGEMLSVWVDGTLVTNNLQVRSSGRGTIALGAGVSESGLAAQTPDDVYDGIFSALTIRDLDEEVFYSYPLVVEIPVEVKQQSSLDRFSRWLKDFF